METTSRHEINYFHNNDLAQEIFWRVFCDFEHYVWDGSIEFLEKIHDFCETSRDFSNFVDKLAFQDFEKNWNDEIYQLAFVFLESINSHLKTRENSEWFSQKEISYIRKKVFAFISYPDQKILLKIQAVKYCTQNIVRIQDYKRKKWE